MNRIGISCVCALMLATLVTIGCGEASSHLSPAAPARVEGVAAQVSGVGSTSSTNVEVSPRLVRDSATIASWTSQNRLRSSAEGLAVEATDVITALTGTCPNVAITVRDAPVTVNTTTVFGTGLSCAGLTVGATVHVTGLLTFGTGGTFSVVATLIAAESTAPVAPVTPAEPEDVAGTVASVTGTCPAITIALVGGGGTVVTSATSTFDPAAGCSTVAAGTVIEARGTRNTGGQLLATSVKVRQAESGHGKKVSGEGTAGHVTGACPTLSMIVAGTHVNTTASTTFENGGCGSVREGTKLVVTGDAQTDGSVTAVVVRITGQPGGKGHDRFDGEGTVGSVTGACPSVTMVIEGYSVVTSATTVFTSGACSDLRAGTKVSVAGTNQGRMLMAETIAILKTKGHGH